MARLAAIAVCAVLLNVVPASAGVMTVDWDVVPHDDQELEPGDSDRHDCVGAYYSLRDCSWLWDGGLALEATGFSFYDDKWVDLYGIDDGNTVQRIHPECVAGRKPCFDLFTPVTLRISGYEDSGVDPNIFLVSSRGGLELLPSLSGTALVDFSGAAWQDLAWIDIGVYFPDECRSGEPPEDEDVCDPATERALVVEELTFQPVPDVPEPAIPALLAVAALAVRLRRRRERAATSSDGSHSHTSSF